MAEVDGVAAGRWPELLEAQPEPASRRHAITRTLMSVVHPMVPSGSRRARSTRATVPRTVRVPLAKRPLRRWAMTPGVSADYVA